MDARFEIRGHQVERVRNPWMITVGSRFTEENMAEQQAEM